MRMRCLLLVAVVAVVGMLACGTKPPVAAATPPKSDQPAQEELYIEISAAGSSDYWLDHKIGLKRISEALGVRTEYVGPANYDMDAMVTAFEQSIARKPDGILVVGFEPVLNAVVAKAMDSGIPVVTVDADLPTSRRIAFVGTGNYQAGFEVGKIMAKSIGGKGKIAVTTMPSADNLRERVRGLRAAIAPYPEIQLMFEADTQGDSNVATQACVTLIQKYPDLAGIASVEAIGGAGAATAVREARKVGQVKIVAMDRGNDVLNAVKEGVIEATVVQQTALMPVYAVQLLHNLKHLNVPISKDDKAAGVSGAPTMIDTGVIIVNRGNCELFMR